MWLMSMALFLPVLGLALLVRFSLYKLMPHWAVQTMVLLLFGITVVAVVVGYHHTTLAPRHSWDSSPLRQYIKDKIIPVILGALLGIGGTLLGLYVRHKYWP